MNTWDQIKVYLWSILVSLDQTINAFLGGHEDQTISGRCGYYAARGSKGYKIAEKIINTVFFDKNHCWDAIEFDVMLDKHPKDLIDLKNQVITRVD